MTLWSIISSQSKFLAYFEAIENPTEFAIHCHKGQVVISIQGTSLYSGWPGVLEPNCLKFYKSSNEIS